MTHKAFLFCMCFVGPVTRVASDLGLVSHQPGKYDTHCPSHIEINLNMPYTTHQALKHDVPNSQEHNPHALFQFVQPQKLSR